MQNFRHMVFLNRCELKRSNPASFPFHLKHTPYIIDLCTPLKTQFYAGKYRFILRIKGLKTLDMVFRDPRGLKHLNTES